jgi:nicotinamide mononucleotide (NMN) deamidase PncC
LRSLTGGGYRSKGNGGAIVYTLAGRSALLGLTAQDMMGIRSASEPFAKLLARRVRATSVPPGV